uniref:Uncharacterized protein n=1 Tax=Calcidiscus leptoporus TaxID=127549 RepID=A0A7S0J8Y7_9EUKA
MATAPTLHLEDGRLAAVDELADLSSTPGAYLHATLADGSLSAPPILSQAASSESSWEEWCDFSAGRNDLLVARANWISMQLQCERREVALTTT